MKGTFSDMKSIYASKLYRASKRKNAITAAIVNSANQGLVQQLADSLDEEYQLKELVDPQSALQEQQAAQGDGPDSSFDTGEDMSSFNPSTDLVSYPGGGGGGISSDDGMFFAEEGQEGEMSEPSGEEGSNDGEIVLDDESEQPAEDSIAESTKINASTCTDFTVNLNVLKDGLNAIQSVAGVNRIVLKESELWIYYNDEINLNNIMTDVIEYVIQRFPDVDFNRLARSDNAVVFEHIKGTPKTSESA